MSLVTFPRQFLVDANGTPRVGAKANFYASGTATPITTYTTGAYAAPHANPVESIAGGLFPAIYVNPAVNATYKMVITDSSDVPLYTEDNITALGFTKDDVSSLLHPQTDEETAKSVVPSSYAVDTTDYTNVMRYVSNTIDGLNSQAAAFQSAIDIAKYSGRTVTVPAPPSGAAYVLDAALNCTISSADSATSANSRGFTFRGEGNQLAVTDSSEVRPILLAKHTGHVFDCTGSLGINFENLSIGTDSTTYPKTCFFFARNSVGGGSQHHISKCYVFGKFSESIVYNYGAEEDQYTGCHFSNREGGANAKVLTFTGYNYRSLTSSFSTIATGQQSTIAHWIFGGSFHNFSRNAAADVCYLEGGAHLTRIFGGHWVCADTIGGGRSYFYMDSTNAVSNELLLTGCGGEASVIQPSYSLYIGDAAGAVAGLSVRDVRFTNSINTIKTHANITVSGASFFGVTNASLGGGINIAGTMTNSYHDSPAGGITVGTYTLNNVISRQGEANFILADASAAAGKKYWIHRSTGGQYVIAIYGDNGTTNIGNPIILTSDGSAVSNLALAASTYSIAVAGLQNFADDAAAAAGGVPVGNMYRTTSTIKVRVA